jgi:hypothetical protein
MGMPGPATVDAGHDSQGSWFPTGPIIATCFMDAQASGIMIALIALTIGIPTLFLEMDHFYG